jgi:hypothetical protein
VRPRGMRRVLTTLVLVATLTVAGCAKGKVNTSPGGPAVPVPPSGQAAPAVGAFQDRARAVVDAYHAHTSIPAPSPNVVHQVVGAQRLTSVGDSTLGYTIGVGGCDHNPSAQVYESADAVVIGGTVERTMGVCPDYLKLQPVTVTLGQPLGSRVVLDVVTGQAVPRQ